MPQSTATYKWNNSLNYTDNFMVETKYYDFGSTSIKKNIYKLSVSLGIPIQDSGISFTTLPSLTVFYRTTTDGLYQFYGNLELNTVTDLITLSSVVQTVDIENKLNGIFGIQFKLAGSMPQDIIINDLSIEYRILRRKRIGNKG